MLFLQPKNVIQKLTEATNPQCLRLLSICLFKLSVCISTRKSDLIISVKRNHRIVKEFVSLKVYFLPPMSLPNFTSLSTLTIDNQTSRIKAKKLKSWIWNFFLFLIVRFKVRSRAIKKFLTFIIYFFTVPLLILYEKKCSVTFLLRS